MSVVKLIQQSHTSGISHPDALKCVVKLSAVASRASELYAHVIEQDLSKRSRTELVLLKALADALQSLGEPL